MTTPPQCALCPLDRNGLLERIAVGLRALDYRSMTVPDLAGFADAVEAAVVGGTACTRVAGELHDRNHLLTRVADLFDDFEPDELTGGDLLDVIRFFEGMLSRRREGARPRLVVVN